MKTGRETDEAPALLGGHFLCLGRAGARRLGWRRVTDGIMGTRITVELWGGTMRCRPDPAIDGGARGK